MGTAMPACQPGYGWAHRAWVDRYATASRAERQPHGVARLPRVRDRQPLKSMTALRNNSYSP
jgi:hypothetical protein